MRRVDEDRRAARRRRTTKPGAEVRPTPARQVQIPRHRPVVGDAFVVPNGVNGEAHPLAHDAPPHVQVKAAGGVRTLDALRETRALGVPRVSATETIGILDAWNNRYAGATG